MPMAMGDGPIPWPMGACSQQGVGRSDFEGRWMDLVGGCGGDVRSVKLVVADINDGKSLGENWSAKPIDEIFSFLCAEGLSLPTSIGTRCRACLAAERRKISNEEGDAFVRQWLTSTQGKTLKCVQEWKAATDKHGLSK